MKNKTLLVLFVLASLLVVLGAIFKIMHLLFANAVLLSGMILQGFVILLVLYKAVRTRTNQQP